MRPAFLRKIACAQHAQIIMDQGLNELQEEMGCTIINKRSGGMKKGLHAQSCVVRSCVECLRRMPAHVQINKRPRRELGSTIRNNISVVESNERYCIPCVGRTLMRSCAAFVLRSGVGACANYNMGSEVEQALEEELGCSIQNKTSVGGGCISNGYSYNTDKGKYFVKVCLLRFIFSLFLENKEKILQIISMTILKN